MHSSLENFFKNLDRCYTDKVKLLLLTSAMWLHLDFFFPLSHSVMQILCYTPGLPQSSVICGWLSKWVFSRGSWTVAEGVRVCSQATSRSHAKTEVSMPITQLMGEIPSGSFGIWCWICRFHFGLWVDAKLLCGGWGGGSSSRGSYSGVLLMSVLKRTLKELNDIKLVYLWKL